MNIGLSSFWQQTITKWKTEEKICARCNQTFTEYNNIGKLKCKQHLSQDRLISNYYDKWPCCNKPYTSSIHFSILGCIKSDHNQRLAPFNEDDRIYLPREIAVDMKIIDKSVIVEDNDTIVYVNRCDIQQLNVALQNYTRNSDMAIYEYDSRLY